MELLAEIHGLKAALHGAEAQCETLRAIAEEHDRLALDLNAIGEFMRAYYGEEIERGEHVGKSTGEVVRRYLIREREHREIIRVSRENPKAGVFMRYLAGDAALLDTLRRLVAMDWLLWIVRRLV
jgi:hypothetical protein